MKTEATRSELLMKVSRLYYEKDLNKTAIAQKIGVSVTQVARLLIEARTEGVVSIKINPPRNASLQRDLITAFPCLKEVVVIGTERDYAVQTRTLAQAAADYFEERVRKGAKVGLSGGLTVFEMVKVLPERERGIKLFPTAILGRGHTIVNHIDPSVSLTILWAKSGYAQDGLFYVTVTPLEMNEKPLTRREIRKAIKTLLDCRKVRWIYEQMRSLDYVFASLRQIDVPAKQQKEMGANAIDLLSDVGITPKELGEEGVIGDLNYSFIDHSGQSRPDWELFLSLQAEDLHKMASHPSKRVVVIAGSNKERILRAALTGRLLNVLITDELTAQTLVTE